MHDRVHGYGLHRLVEIGSDSLSRNGIRYELTGTLAPERRVQVAREVIAVEPQCVALRFVERTVRFLPPVPVSRALFGERTAALAELVVRPLIRGFTWFPGSRRRVQGRAACASDDAVFTECWAVRRRDLVTGGARCDLDVADVVLMASPIGAELRVCDLVGIRHVGSRRIQQPGFGRCWCLSRRRRGWSLKRYRPFVNGRPLDVVCQNLRTAFRELDVAHVFRRRSDHGVSFVSAMGFEGIQSSVDVRVRRDVGAAEGRRGRRRCLCGTARTHSWRRSRGNWRRSRGNRCASCRLRRASRWGRPASANERRSATRGKSATSSSSPRRTGPHCCHAFPNAAGTHRLRQCLAQSGLGVAHDCIRFGLSASQPGRVWPRRRSRRTSRLGHIVGGVSLCQSGLGHVNQGFCCCTTQTSVSFWSGPACAATARRASAALRAVRA